MRLLPHATAIHQRPRLVRKADAVNAKAVFAALASFGALLTGITEDLADPGKFFRFGKEPIAIDALPSIDGVDFDSAWERRIEGIVDEQSGLKEFFISKPDHSV